MFSGCFKTFDPLGVVVLDVDVGVAPGVALDVAPEVDVAACVEVSYTDTVIGSEVAVKSSTWTVVDSASVDSVKLVEELESVSVAVSEVLVISVPQVNDAHKLIK